MTSTANDELVLNEITKTLRVKGADLTKVSQEEKTSPEDVAGMLSLGSLKARAIKQLIAKRGLRPGVIGNTEGTDGLKLADLPDLILTTSSATFSKRIPALLVRPELSKTKRMCTGFLTNAAAASLLSLLNDRLASGEALSRESVLVPPAPTISSRAVPRKFMTSAAVSKEVRDSIRPLYKQRPYALRVFTEQSLVTAESRAGVPREFWQHWMNHKGGIDARYTVNRPLPDFVVEEMRDAFSRAEPLLDVEVGREAERNKLLRKVQSGSLDADEETLRRVAEMFEASRNPGAAGSHVGAGGEPHLGRMDLRRGPPQRQGGPAEGYSRR